MKDYRFTKDHEWVSAAQDGIVTVGISDHAQQELGDIVFVELKEVDSALEQGEVASTIESVKAASDIYSPVKGKITEINEELEDNPSLVNESPEDEGWLFRIEVEDMSQLDSLMSADEYEKYLAEQE